MAVIGTMEDFINSKVEPKTINGKCSSCGECCSDILPMNQKEIRRIREYIQRKHIKECKNVVAVKKYDLTCLFRDNALKICTIYEVRPEICRDFVCNKSPHEAAKNRRLIEGSRTPVLMRHEFFGATQDVEAMNILSGGVLHWE